MKRLIALILTIIIALPTTGCALFGTSNWGDNTEQLEMDIHLLSKLATRIILVETNVSKDDATAIEEYLIVLKDFLIISDHVDFAGARVLINTRLAPKYRIYCLTVVDILERYLRTINLDINEDHELIITLIASGINGAIEAVQEFGS